MDNLIEKEIGTFEITSGSVIISDLTDYLNDGQIDPSGEVENGIWKIRTYSDSASNILYFIATINKSNNYKPFAENWSEEEYFIIPSSNIIIYDSDHNFIDDNEVIINDNEQYQIMKSGYIIKLEENTNITGKLLMDTNHTIIGIQIINYEQPANVLVLDDEPGDTTVLNHTNEDNDKRVI